MRSFGAGNRAVDGTMTYPCCSSSGRVSFTALVVVSLSTANSRPRTAWVQSLRW
jgi:hypothetical protein